MNPIDSFFGLFALVLGEFEAFFADF